jgi:hypothetical protein
MEQKKVRWLSNNKHQKRMSKERTRWWCQSNFYGKGWRDSGRASPKLASRQDCMIDLWMENLNLTQN